MLSGPPSGPASGPDPRRRIMLVDDHPVTRRGLVGLIESQPDLMICGEAGDPASAIAGFLAWRPELILSDLNMPGRGGIEFIKDLLAYDPHIKVLVITMQNEDEFVERVLRAGARGFIMKTAGADVLLAAIRQVLNGGIYVSPSVSSRLLHAMTGPAQRPSTSPLAVLSDRELEVFQLIGEGKDASDIADVLRISRKTVDVHRAAIKRKLGLPTPTALVRQAVRWVEDSRGSTGAVVILIALGLLGILNPLKFFLSFDAN